MTQAVVVQREREVASDMLDPNLVREVKAILSKAEWIDEVRQQQEMIGAPKASLRYTMPQPGIRYYRF